MSDQARQATRQLQFWIAAFAITAINLSVWMFSPGWGPGSSRPTTTTPAVLRVLHSSSSQRLARDGRFELVLDQDALDPDLAGRRFERPPFRFDPGIDGVWEVVDHRTISFEPDAEIGPGRLLRLVADATHPLFAPYAFDESSLPVLRYRPLAMTWMNLGNIVLTSDGPDTATLAIEFNQPVRWSDLLEHSTIEVAGTMLKADQLERLGEPLAERHEIRIPVRTGGRVNVVLDGALRGENDLLGLETPIRRSFGVAGDLTDLRIWAHADWYRDPEGRNRTIRMGFDRALDPGQVPSVRVEPNPGDVRTSVWRDQIVLRGPFEAGRVYKVTVDQPLLGADRSLLRRPAVRSVRMSTPDPHLDFEPSQGQIMPHGRFELGLRHGGHANARLRIHRLVDEHLSMILGEFLGDHRIPRAGETLHDAVIPLPRFDGGHGTTMLSLDRYIDRKPGLYRVEIRATDDSWDRDAVTLLVSDLALDLEVSPDSTLAWVTSISTGEPVPNAEVVAWAPNITPTDTGTTGPDGLVDLEVFGDDARVITARVGDDVVFLRPRRARGLDDRDLAGDPWSGPMDAALYPERGIHRPGETIHLSAVVRTRDGEPVVGSPFEIRWTRPDGRVDATIEGVTDEVQGVMQVDIPTRSSDPTGRWKAALHLPGAKEAVASIECPVMPFLPVRLRVETEADEREDGLEVSTRTSYLHGAPAAGLPATITARFTPIAYRDDRFPDFTFEPKRKVEIVRRKTELVLDEDGRATTRFPLPEAAATWNLTATASARELGGRATSAGVDRRVDTQGVHLGLRLPDGRIHLPGDPIRLDAAVVVDGEPSTDQVPTVRLERIDRDWRYERIEGRWRWRSTETTEAVAIEPDLEIEGRHHAITLPALDDGEYRVRCTMPGGDAAAAPLVSTTVDFHVSRWRAEGRMSVERSDRIEIVPGAETVARGGTLPVILRSPFPGTALVTIETDRVIDTHVTTIDGDGVKLDLPMPTEARDTAFISATVVRPLDADRDAWAPLVARGAARVRIDREPHLLQPEIDAIDFARPGDLVSAVVTVPGASADAVVHLWAVEEGALLPTDHHAENPADHLLRDRRRTVTAISSIVDLIPEFDRTVASDAIGGDRASARREPVPVRLPDTRVIWRTAERLGEDGVLEAALEMPTLDGAMRLMAVAVDRDRYGATERLVAVMPAIQVVAALPRTAAPGDAMTVPVTLRNHLQATADVSLVVNGGVGLEIEPRSRTVTLDPGASSVVEIDLKARQLGATSLGLVAAAHENDRLLETTLEWNIAVRPPFGMQRETRRIVVAPGASEPIERDRRLQGFGGSVEIVMSDGPEVDLRSAVEDLVDYPYGCGEQIGSRVEGLLATLLVDPAIGGVDPATVRSMAAVGLGRLWETQTPDGRIPYWSGGQGDDWLTARTALLATRAADRGVEMPDTFRPALMKASARIASNPRVARSTRLLAARALATEGLLDSAVLEMLHLERDGLGLAARAHLAMALHLGGDLAKAIDLVDSFSVPMFQAPTDQGRFTSDTTEAAVALAVGLEVLPSADSLAALHLMITEGLGDRRWRTTYETAAAVEALARWSEAHPGKGGASGTVEIAGRSIRFDGSEPVRERIEIPAGSAPAVAERVVSDGDGPLFLTITTSGVPVEDDPDAHLQPHAHHGLEVERTWFDAVGEPIDPSTAIRAGETVIVEIAYRSTLGSPLANVAVVDVLPSGFEIELPTLLTSDAGETNLDAVDHTEFRDDRVIVFDTATEQFQRFRYAIRAVVPGDWIRPGTTGEAMYHDAVRSVLPNDRVTVNAE